MRIPCNEESERDTLGASETEQQRTRLALHVRRHVREIDPWQVGDEYIH